VLAVYGGEGPHPFLGDSSLTLSYVGWVGAWVVLMLWLASVSFQQRDL
jgi:hypothetical protein